MDNDQNQLWVERIKDYKASGLTAAKWCEKKEIAIHALRYQITKFNKKKKKEGSKKTQWASAVTKKTVISNATSKPLKIIIGKATIEVAPGFDPQAFQTVARILSAQC